MLIGIAAAAFLLWEPTIEGRNVNATYFEIYFKDPFLAYAYIASVPFFIGVYKAFKALGYAGRGMAFSEQTLKALQAIKYCAILIIVFVAGGEIYIMSLKSDDRAGGIFMGLLITLGSIIVIAAEARLQRRLNNSERR